MKMDAVESKTWEDRLNIVDGNAKGQDWREVYNQLSNLWIVWKQVGIMVS